MPYDVSGGMRFGSPIGSYLNARDNAQQNALLQRRQQMDEEAFAAEQEAAQYNRQRQDQADALTAQKAAAEAEAHDHQKLTAYLQQLAAAKDPRHFQYLAQRIPQTPEARRFGITPEDLTPDNVNEYLSAAMAEGGQGPAPAPKQYERLEGPRGSILQRDPQTGELKQVVGPDNSQPAPPKPAASYRALTPPEIEAAGLPPGTSAQVGPDGKIDILSKRDNTAVLSQKDATTAKMKLNTIALARQQLNKIREAYEGEKDPKTGKIKPRTGIKGTMSAGGAGQGYIPTVGGKKFDARVNQMRSTLTALTRVPGVGAMSDYETKLDQSKFPDRAQYETVIADTIQNLDDQLALLENGYKSLLSGGELPGKQESPPPNAPTATGPNGQKLILQNGQWVPLGR